MELATIESEPQMAVIQMERAQQVADVCKSMIEQTAVNIQGKKYPPVECWQSIANAHGCVLSSKDVERTATGFKAIGEVRKAATGELIATAEGFVGDDEPTWAKRPEYAKRAMAQTRAMSRAGRSAFAYIAVLAKIPNLKTTPAEEVPHGGFDDRPSVRPPMRTASEVLEGEVLEPGSIDEEASFDLGVEPPTGALEVSGEVTNKYPAEGKGPNKIVIAGEKFAMWPKDKVLCTRFSKAWNDGRRNFKVTYTSAASKCGKYTNHTVVDIIPL